ncbi:nucleotidyltransferase family protein [Candidatus Pacearchaeota archaeon]|nr:nucleotidyltransferase family protein [Candidatus Pacearchaeota archaeon]
MNNAVGEISRKIIDVLKKAGVKRAGIFGSYARGEQKRSSDVDILIEVEKGRKFSLFDLVGLKMEIESILKRKVDLLTYNGISHFIRENVLKDEVRIM